MEFKRTEVKAKIYGQEYSLRKATFDEREEFSSQMDEAVKAKNTRELVKLQREFAIKLGLPRDLVGQMEADHVDQLLLSLLGKKNG